MLNTLILLVLLLSILPTSVYAGDWYGVKTFRCNYSVNTVGEFSNGSLKPKLGEENFGFIVDNVDLQTGKARLIGSLGGSDMAVISSDDALNLIEVTFSGNVTTTSIFRERNTEGSFVSVHSRNMHTIDTPMPSQYYGACEGLP